MGTTAHGIIFIDKTNSSKQLFFPAAGYAFNGNYGYVSSSGYYWSCSIDSNNILRGRYMYLNNGNNVYYYGSSRNGGFSVRGILDE